MDEVRVDHHSPVVSRRISWGGVIAGVVVALALQIVLNLLPMSFGLTFIGPDSAGSGSTIAWTTGILYLLMTALALFCGAFVAARLSNIPKASTGMLHGFLVWSLSVIVGTLGLSYATAGIAGQVGQALQGAVAAAGQIPIQKMVPEDVKQQMASLDINLENIRQEARQILKQTGDPKLQPEDIEREASELKDIAKETARDVAMSPGDMDKDVQEMVRQMIQTTEGTLKAISAEDIANVVAARSDLSQEEALKVGQRWKSEIDKAIANLDQNLEQASQTVQAGVDQGLDRVAQLAFALFVILAVGGGVSVLGGSMGRPRTNDLG